MSTNAFWKYPQSWYFHLYHFIAKARLKNGDMNLRQLHIHLIVILCTCPFMWAFVILGHLTISDPRAAIIGYTCASVASVSPLIYRFTARGNLLGSLALISGFIQITTHSYYTGGIQSFGLVWLAILPFTAGIIIGRRAAVVWALLAIGVAKLFLLAEWLGFDCPIMITGDGYRWSRTLTIIGWIYLNTILFFIFALYRDNLDRILQDQKQKIDDLFRVLFHDLANPLGRIDIGLQIARKQENSPATLRGLEIAQQATRAMLDITHSVRKMYAVSHGKAKVDLEYSLLNDSIRFVTHMLQAELERKNISLLYDFKYNQNLEILVELVGFNNQVLANILSNAIKFSPPGGNIYITSFKLEDSLVRIDIQDEGIGMSPSLLSDLFQMNKKTSRSGTTGEKGTGFGMHIMKSFVEMYGGKVEVISQDDTFKSGTTLSLYLKAQWG